MSSFNCKYSGAGLKSPKDEMKPIVLTGHAVVAPAEWCAQFLCVFNQVNVSINNT